MPRIKNSISREDAEKKLIKALAEMIMDIRETCDSDIESTLEYMSGMVPSISIGEIFNIVRDESKAYTSIETTSDAVWCDRCGQELGNKRYIRKAYAFCSETCAEKHLQDFGE